jgi:DNA-directed RNA polymerase subunit RPC12/RpoP
MYIFEFLIVYIIIMQETEPEWLSKVASHPKCPYCNSGILDTRVHRSFSYKYLVFWGKFKRYQCNNCEKTLHIRDSVVS